MGQRFDAVATPVQAIDFLVALQRAIPESTPTMRAVLAAQSALETGRWRACICHNVGNFKSGADQDHTFFATTERLPLAQANADVARSTIAAPCHIASVFTGIAGQPVAIVRYEPDHPTCRFRAYTTIDEGVADYVSLLRKRWGCAWSAAEAGDPALFVRRLKEGHYFTGDETAYVSAVVSLFREFSRGA